MTNTLLKMETINLVLLRKFLRPGFININLFKMIKESEVLLSKYLEISTQDQEHIFCLFKEGVKIVIGIPFLAI